MNQNDIPTLKIKPEFQKLIPPLSKYEREGLEAEIRYWARCYSPIITWKDFIADGHHRYAICQKYGLPFKTEELNIQDEISVKRWMIDNQFKRRNLQLHVKLDLAFEDEELEQEEARQRMLAGKKLIPRSLVTEGGEEKTGKALEKVAQKAECSYGTAFQYKKIKVAGLRDRVVKGESIKKVYSELQRNERQTTLKNSQFPQGKYRVIYADPPWDYGSSPTAKNTATPDLKYPVMSLEDICAMPVKGIADENAVLFLWTTSYHIFQSQTVLESWGFTYKSMFVWDKVKHNMGCYNSVRHEILLIATKGQCPPDNVELFDSVTK